MKLVTNTTTKLGAEGGAALMEYIDASLEKDQQYFDFMGNLRNLLSGDHWANVKGAKRSKDELRLVINLAHAHVRSLVPTLFFRNPTADCYPTSPRHAGKEKTWNGILNGTWDKIGFKKQFKAAVLDAVTYPEGVIKHIVNKPEDEGERTEHGQSGPVEWLSKGTPVHVRQNPRQLLVDYRVKDRDIENARYIAFRYRKPKSELLAHPVYGPNIDDKTLSSEKPPSTGNLVGVQTTDKEDWDESEPYKTTSDSFEQLVTIYEVWIHQLIAQSGQFKCYQQMCVLMEGQNKPIKELTDWSEVMGEGFNKFPCTRIVLLPIPDFLPNSELGSWQGLQMSVNWLVSRITQLVENDRQILLTDPSKFKNFEKFKKEFYGGRSRTLAEVNDPSAAELLQPTFVGRDNYPLLQIIQGFQKEVAGLGQNRRGGSGIRTASEAHIIEQGVQLKTDEKVDIISDALQDIAFKSTMIIRSLVRSEPGGLEWIFRIGGDIGTVNWLNFTSDDINWLPEVRIRADSFRKADTSVDMQKFAGLIQIGIQITTMGVPVNVGELYVRMLEAAGIADAQRLVAGHDNEFMLQVVEIGAMIGGIMVPAREGENHPSHIQAMEAFEQSPIGQSLLAQSPEFMDKFMQHKEWHNQLLMEQQQKQSVSQATAQNPFAAVSFSENPTPQSEANTVTGDSRNAVAPQPGGRGAYS